MSNVYAFLADGLEEVECLAVTDLLVRAGIQVTLVSITGTKEVTGSHGFRIGTDALLTEVNCSEADVLFLPGGMPGTNNLAACAALSEELIKADREGRRLAAICAAPSVLGRLGLLKGRKATCFPGFEPELAGAEISTDPVVTDGTVTTATGLGCALDLGLELIRLLVSGEKAAAIKAAIQYV